MTVTDGPAVARIRARLARIQPDRPVGRGFRDCLRADPGGEASGIPARIAFDSGDYDGDRWYQEAVGYARLRSRPIVSCSPEQLSEAQGVKTIGSGPFRFRGILK